MSPAFQFGTAALSVGGSAGARLATDAHSESELPAGAVPEGSEDPVFFSLLEDDHSSRGSTFPHTVGYREPSHVHVDLLVRVKPSIPDTRNLIFA